MSRLFLGLPPAAGVLRSPFAPGFGMSPGRLGSGWLPLLIGLIAGLVGAALILVVAGLAVGAGIFGVGGLDLRFSFGQFVVEFYIGLVALVLFLSFFADPFPPSFLPELFPRRPCRSPGCCRPQF